MKKLLVLISIFFIIFICGCSDKNSAADAVKEYLNKYQNNDSVILNQLDDYIENEEFSDLQKEKYNKILTNQYKNLKYEIMEEQYDEDEAIVTVKITVYDFYIIQKNATQYLMENPSEFNGEDGNYSKSLFLDYKLNQMANVSETVDYMIDFFVSMENSVWVVNPPSIIMLEKIHGIYNYDNK